MWPTANPSFRPSDCPGIFLELDHFFLYLSMMLEIHMKMYVADSDFLEYFFPKSLGRWAKNRFFEFIDKILSSLFAESAL